MRPRSFRTVLATLAVALLAGVAPVLAQELTVDNKLADQGKSVYNGKGGCAACHTIGKGRSAGPDLRGVTERRELDWIRKLLTDTDEMLDTDSVAKALLKEYNYVRMRIPKLSSQEVEAVMHYLVKETSK